MLSSWGRAGCGDQVPGKQDSKAQLTNCGPRAKSGPPLVFINKVLLELSCAHSSMYSLWLLCDIGRVKQLQQKLKYLLPAPFTEVYWPCWRVSSSSGPWIDIMLTQSCRLSSVWLFVILWTTGHQAPLSMEFSGQDYWSGLLCPPPGDLPDPGMEPVSLISPALAVRFFVTSST